MYIYVNHRTASIKKQIFLPIILLGCDVIFCLFPLWIVYGRMNKKTSKQLISNENTKF